jgi:hypothetical protein
MPVDFTAFAASVAATAAATLNHVEGLLTPDGEKPAEGEDPPSPEERAKQAQSGLGTAGQLIDTLVMLEEKTKGNLSDEEKQFLDASLTELRITYVRLRKQSQPPAA